MSAALDAVPPLPARTLSLGLGLAFALALPVAVGLAQENVVVFGQAGAARYGDTVRDGTAGTWRRRADLGGTPSWCMETPAETSRGRLDLRTDSVSRALFPRNSGGAGLTRSGLRTAPPR
ncbi:MAG: hypothetical protein AAF844_15265 [Pseudomonadota bacterium]